MSIKQSKFIVMFLFSLFIIGLPAVNVYAAASLSLYDYGTKKDIKYTDKQVQYNYNGSSINMKNTPGIIINGTALASYQETFVSASLKAKATYSKTKNTVTLKKDNTTIVLTVGSKKAKVNGKTVTMSVAPMKVKYKAQSTTKILIPTRFVTETFGYKYLWNSSTSSVNIITPRFLYYNREI
jgi:N-acetylmuramoyl-L-alanine amidase